MIHDDSVHTMQRFLISAQQVVVHWVHRASRRTQSDTALHKKNPETVPWLSQDLEASDLPCLEA